MNKEKIIGEEGMKTKKYSHNSRLLSIIDDTGDALSDLFTKIFCRVLTYEIINVTVQRTEKGYKPKVKHEGDSILPFYQRLKIISQLQKVAEEKLEKDPTLNNYNIKSKCSVSEFDPFGIKRLRHYQNSKI